MTRPDPILTEAAGRGPDQNTSVIPGAFFSPLSYSLSVDESSSRYHQPMRPPPPPSTQKNERSRLLSFSQDYTPRSLLSQPTFTKSTTKKDVQDLLVYIDKMAFSEDKHPTFSNSQGLPATKRSSKALRDRTNQAPFPEMTPVKTAKTPRGTPTSSSSPNKQPPRPNTMTTPAAATIQRKDDPPPTTEMTSLIADLANASTDDDPAWTRLEEMAARVRRALDPEPSDINSFQEAESTVLRTAFSELGPRQEETPRNLSNELNVSPSHSTIALQKHSEGDETGVGLRIASPEDAKKLLRTAVTALHDARAERESARQWANSMKEAVNKWVDEQRKLIQTETTTRLGAIQTHEEQIRTQTESLSKLEHSIQTVYAELTASNQTRQSTEKQLKRLLLDQQEKMHTLGQQLASIEQTVTEQGTRSSMASRAGFSGRLPSPKDTVIPRFVDKTPKVSSGSQASSASSSRVKRRTKDGGHVIAYSNGVQKEVHPDGTTVIRFANGDVETKFAESGTVAYFHKEDRVMQITTADGSTLFEYPNRQIERHYPDGSKAILYPDGSKQMISPRRCTESGFE